jgi:hypothetical protein
VLSLGRDVASYLVESVYYLKSQTIFVAGFEARDYDLTT